MCSWRNQILLESISRYIPNTENTCTLRFDFRGNGSSSDSWSYDYSETRDLDDLLTALEYLRSKSYTVERIIGHSQACRTLTKYYSTISDAPEKCVLLSGRYTPVPTPIGRFTTEQMDELETKGEFCWFKRGPRSFIVDAQSCVRRSNMDIPGLIKKINENSQIVRFKIVHGDNDDTVPVEDGRRFRDAIVNSEYLEVEGANHGFNGTKHLSAIVEFILKE